MRRLLEKLSRESLLDFIEEYAARDDVFANAVNVRFAEPEYEDKFVRYRGEACHVGKPRGAQEEAFCKGLIPYIPADRME